MKCSIFLYHWTLGILLKGRRRIYWLLHWSFHWSKSSIQLLALFGTVSQSFSDVKYKTYQSYQFHQPQQRVLVIIFSKGVPMTKPSVQHPSLIGEHISRWSLASTAEWNGSIVSLIAFTLQGNLAHCEAQAHIRIWISALRITLPTQE